MDQPEDNIKVSLQLFGNLRIKGKAVGEIMELDLPADFTTQKLIDKFQLTDIKIVFVNNLIQTQECTLTAGDRVAIFPAIAGG